MRIALAQINPTVGDIDGNTDRIIDYCHKAANERADLVVLPELSVLGYPPKDLLSREALIDRNINAVNRIAEMTRETTVIVGFAARNKTGRGNRLHNAAAICQNGRVAAVCGKNLLPTYDVFDERRYFEPDRSSDICTLEIAGQTRRIGLTICEDLWNNEQFENQQVYDHDPVADLAAEKAEIIVNLSASPFWVDKHEHRTKIFSRQAAEHGLPIIYVNQVGGNDDLLFDGASAAFDPQGNVVAQAAAFEEDLVIVDADGWAPARVAPYPGRIESVLGGLVLGVRDYITKCGFEHVVMGLSGGIDSAVTAAIAVEALGADRVHGVAMPSRFSSDHSVADARSVAENLGIDFRIIPIEGLHRAAEQALAESFDGTESGVAEENLQARARGLILMALSNKFGWLLLTTGNKSELAVGYCTLYGDMCGGLAVISDVPKMMVYDIARFINNRAGHAVIPISTIEKPPSAELREGQVDSDSLPPYPLLDQILHRYVERDESIEQIADAGFDRQLVERIARMVDRNEYKRMQAALGIKVTEKAFGPGRRMPISMRLNQST